MWVGFQAEFLTAANLPTDEAVQSFLYDWHSHASSNCANNPIDVSRSASGATNCHKLTSTRTAKAYTSHAQAASAFARQINSGAFPHLLAALKAPSPYNVADPAAVASDLVKWGSKAFATYYGSTATTTGSGGGGGGGITGQTPRGHHGFADMQKALAHTMPTKLRRAHIIRQRVLRKLGAPRKVG